MIDHHPRRHPPRTGRGIARGILQRHDRLARPHHGRGDLPLDVIPDRQQFLIAAVALVSGVRSDRVRAIRRGRHPRRPRPAADAPAFRNPDRLLRRPPDRPARRRPWHRRLPGPAADHPHPDPSKPQQRRRRGTNGQHQYGATSQASCPTARVPVMRGVERHFAVGSRGSGVGRRQQLQQAVSSGNRNRPLYCLLPAIDCLLRLVHRLDVASVGRHGRPMLEVVTEARRRPSLLPVAASAAGVGSAGGWTGSAWANWPVAMSGSSSGSDSASTGASGWGPDGNSTIAATGAAFSRILASAPARCRHDAGKTTRSARTDAARLAPAIRQRPVAVRGDRTDGPRPALPHRSPRPPNPAASSTSLRVSSHPGRLQRPFAVEGSQIWFPAGRSTPWPAVSPGRRANDGLRSDAPARATTTAHRERSAASPQRRPEHPSNATARTVAHGTLGTS